LGKKITVCFQYYNFHDSIISISIIVDYIESSNLHDQIQTILDYLWIMYIQPKSIFIDTIEIYDIINKTESIIPYDEYYINNIKLGEDLITNSNKQYYGYLTKTSNKIIFKLDDDQFKN